MAITYKNLYSLTVDEIEKRLDFLKTEQYKSQLSGRTITGGGDRLAQISAYDIITSLQDVLSEIVPSRIIEGLEVTAEDPISDKVIVSAGSGIVNGTIYTLTSDMRLTMPFDTTTSTYFVTLYDNGVYIDRTLSPQKLTLAKIVVPNPGVTSLVQDRRDESWNAFIVQYRNLDLYWDGHSYLEEDSIDILRNSIGDILADNLIGNIRLSEDLKIINTAGTMELNSNSLQFFDYEGNELAYFGSTLARIGNISITPHTLQSGNYVPNVSGFVIYDYGDAEFNNIRLRGTLYTSTIAENIYINPGIRFIGDLNLDDDLALLAGKKLIFDRDMGNDTYWRYNPDTAYLEGWVDGDKRIEL